MGAALLVLALLLAAAVPPLSASSGGDAHPGYSDEGTCTVDAAAAAELRRLEEHVPGRRIIDITHAYVPDLPAFANGAVMGPVVRLKESMADGSEYNLSELRMECHAGTHVDAPGHMNQGHFAAGRDVDTLDLDVLNGPALLVDVPRDTDITAEAMKFLNIPRGVRRVLFRTLNTDRKLMWRKGGDMSYVGFTEDGAQWLVDNTDIKLIGIDGLSVASFDYLISAHVVLFKTPPALIFLPSGLRAMASASPLMAMLLLASTLAPRVPAARGSGMSAAHPAYADATAYGPAASAVEAGRLEEYGGGRIVDITHAYRPELPFPGRDGLGAVTRLTESMANGSVNNVSELRMVVHSGTHVDAPGHMVQEHFEAGLGVDKLDLDVLNGPALLIDVPRDTNITAQAMESLNITKGIRRVLFRTLNTDRKLMWTKEIDTSFVGFTEDGAQWLVDNTDIKLVGIDYLSVAAFDHLISAHLVFLNRRDIIPIEGLKLDHVKTGVYMLHCLPLRLIGCDGSPIRCILIK